MKERAGFSVEYFCQDLEAFRLSEALDVYLIVLKQCRDEFGFLRIVEGNELAVEQVGLRKVGDEVVAVACAGRIFEDAALEVEINGA